MTMNGPHSHHHCHYYCHSTTKQQKGPMKSAPMWMDKEREKDGGRGMFLILTPPHIDDKWSPRSVSGPFFFLLFSVLLFSRHVTQAPANNPIHNHHSTTSTCQIATAIALVAAVVAGQQEDSSWAGARNATRLEPLSMFILIYFNFISINIHLDWS